MKSKVLVTAISALLLAAPAVAAEFNPGSSDLSDYKQKANQHIDDLPGFVKDLVGDQDINVYVDRNQSENYNFSIQMNETRVEQIGNSSLENPDLEAWTSSRVIENITESEKPVQNMKSAVDTGEIRYQANDVWTKVKIFFAETFMNLV